MGVSKVEDPVEGVLGQYANNLWLGPGCTCGKSLYDFVLAKRFRMTLSHAKDTATIHPPLQFCRFCGEVLTPTLADKAPVNGGATRE